MQQELTPVTSFVFETQPYAHQLEALRKSCFLTYFAYLMDMGTGKSKVILDNMAILYEAGKITTGIIIAPNSVYRNWFLREIPTHFPERIIRRYYIHKQDKIDKIIDFLDNKKEIFNFILINVEAFSRPTELFSFLVKYQTLTPCYLVVDESTCIKGRKASRSKAIVKLGKYAKYRRIATGLVAPKGPTDVFPQFEFLQPGCLGTSNPIAFAQRYCETVPIPVGGRIIEKTVGVKNVKELQDKIAALSYRVTKEQCLDLPNKMYDFLYSELDEESNYHYDRMKEEAIFELEHEDPNLSIFVRSTNRINMLMRLQMITCGHMKTPEGQSVRFSSKRINDTIEHLSRIDGSVIIWSYYIKDVIDLTAAIRKEFGEKSAYSFHGDTSLADRDEAVTRFQAKQSRFLVINPATGRFGLTLTASSTSIYYSNSYDLEHRIQSEDRIHRIGQKFSCLYIDVLSLNTINMDMIENLRRKINISTAIQGDEYRKWLL